jgi:hypothetical protein
MNTHLPRYPLIQRIHGDDVNLDYFTYRAIEGAVVVECDLCGEHITPIEPPDTVKVIVDRARDHILGGNCNAERPR